MAKMEHLLDNPVWNALISGNEELSYGTDTVKYFSPDVSPFVGLKDYHTDHFLTLYHQLENGRICAVACSNEVTIPDFWKTLHQLKVLQMVYNRSIRPTNVSINESIVSLTEAHIPQMLQLTQLTRPGPFEQDTIQFGHYEGIFHGQQLIAMAGQRLYPQPYAEISAVCTHPDHTGKGLAGQLIESQIARMLSASAIPFLHVVPENSRAINLYERLGFTTRTALFISIIQKP